MQIKWHQLLLVNLCGKYLGMYIYCVLLVIFRGHLHAKNVVSLVTYGYLFTWSIGICMSYILFKLQPV